MTSESPGPALAGVAGTHVIAGEAGPPRTTQDALPPVAPAVALVSGERPSQPPGTPVPAGRGGPLLVDGEGPSTRGGTLRITGPSPTSVLGCVPGGLGSSPPRPASIGGVVSSGELSPHQPARDESPVPRPAVVQKPGHRPPSDCHVQQLNGGSLRQQAGGGTVSSALCLLTGQLLRWAETRDIQLEARYLPG